MLAAPFMTRRLTKEFIEKNGRSPTKDEFIEIQREAVNTLINNNSVYGICGQGETKMSEIVLKLNVKNVEEIFKDCLLPDDYNNDTKVIVVRVVTGTYGFDPKKLDKHSNNIREMISQLSSNFDECHQGYTFMDLPFKRDGDSKRQWGEQRHGDLLMALGLASGWMKMTSEDPKLWKILPGGVPYVYRAEKRQDMTDKITTVGKVMESRI